MKMPGNQSNDSGIYDYEENAYFGEGLENNVMEELNGPPDNDFSEYLWMENEEEFDKEVMQRLEEEALMEECMAFMNDENNVPNGTTNNTPTTQPNNQTVSPSQEKVVNSKLNPEAAEFVPLSRRPCSEAPTKTSS